MNVARGFALPALALVGVALPVHTSAKGGRDGAPGIVGDCFTIHGRLSCYNGTPSFRIWKVGTHRLFGVVDDDVENPRFPDNLARAHPDFGTDIYGDFLVCPLTASKPGWMQMVKIRSARHLVVRREADP